MVKTKKSIVDLNVAPIFEIINAIEQNLRKCFKKQPSAEIEVQDEVEKILNIRQVKCNRDNESFPYSSKSYKPDFVLEDFDTVIEIKLCNAKEDEKKIIAEINDDIQAYLSKYKLAIFLVYDVSVIRDVDLFKKDLTKNPKVLVYVIKHWGNGVFKWSEYGKTVVVEFAKEREKYIKAKEREYKERNSSN